VSDESNIKIGRASLKVAARLGDQFGVSQKLVVEQAIHEFFERYKAASQLPLRSMAIREEHANYDATRKKDVKP
jgi:hypothetical protein